eukprot:4799191-Pleurochrysis_carterae.AAC.1
MVILRPCRALLRSSFHSSLPLACSRIQAAVLSAWPTKDDARTRVVAACSSADVVRARKSKEALSARACHRHAAQALAVLGDDALGCTDAAGEELSRVVARCSGQRREGRRQQAPDEQIPSC